MLLNTSGQNLTFAGLQVHGWGFILLALFILTIPLLAETEEKVFRATALQPELERELIKKGFIRWLPQPKMHVEVEGGDWFYTLYWKWSLAGWIVRSITFGLVHCIIGVPIGVGLALSLAGVWFTIQYIKGGLDRSTLYHSAYNLNIALIVLVVQSLSLFQ